MADSYYGGINLTNLLAKLSEKHSAFSKDKNGQIWCNCTIWCNENEDQFGNSASMQLNSKDYAAGEKKIYIGNFKKNKPKDRPIVDNDIKEVQTQFKTTLEDDGLPF